ncbi:hypothetical protein A3K63_04835 [Candidatus Micrarchaeota archaeon RBG_16_49_10]|nr:MAG: hypothetical protein A3K63_04835 [Candidatus Micrarchaeota archaeon RBG_16_49_10]
MRESQIIFMDIIEQLLAGHRRESVVGSKTRKVFESICSKWPANPLEVASSLDEEGDVKTLSAKYLYHFRKLSESGLIRMKKIGNTYVAWPTDIEKLRMIHHMTREM